MHELAAGLRRAGHDVSILSTGAAHGRDRVLDVPVSRLRHRRVLPSRFGDVASEVGFAVQALLRLLPRRMDVWHANTTVDAAAAALAGRLRPRLGTAHTNLGVPLRSWWQPRPDRRFHEYAVRHLDVYGCLSETAAHHLRDEYARDGVVVGAGVDLSAFTPAATRQSRPAILFPSSLDEPRKNAKLLLAAVDLLLRRGIELDLWLAGPGDVEAALRDTSQRVRDAVAIAELVSLDRLRELYRRAWVTALPSHHEAFGLTVVESHASGTPAVALRDGGGPAELISSSNGVLCEATPASLADALEAALTMARDPGVVALCRASAERWDWDRSIVPHMVELYEQACS